MKLNNIAIIRSLCIFAIVIFHTYGYMYAAAHFPDTVSVYHKTYFWFNQCVIVNIAMPMFTVISGFLFAWLFAKGKYQEFGAFIYKKCLRLLLPFFIFGILMMLTTGETFRPWSLLSGGFSHLWYLPALFWCFAAGWPFKKFVKNVYVQIAILVFFLLLQTQERFLPRIIGMHNFSCWFGWFLLGEVIATYNDSVKKMIERYHLVIPLCIPFCVQASLYPVEYGVATWYSVLGITLLAIGILYFNWDMIGDLAKPLILFSQYSFGVFIFHNYVGPFLISRTAKRILPLSEWAADYTIIFPISLTILILFISFLLSWALMKTKVGKILIG